MLKNLTPYLTLVGLKGDATTCARDIKQTVSEIDAMRENAEALLKALQGYTGGILNAVPIAHKLRAGQQAAGRAIKSLDADTTPFSDAEVVEAMPVYDQMVFAVLEALHASVDKVPEFKKAGVAGIAHGLVQGLYADKNRFEEAYKRKLGDGKDRDISKSAEQVDSAFKTVLAAFSS